jgi:hypothetical protein
MVKLAVDALEYTFTFVLYCSQFLAEVQTLQSTVQQDVSSTLQSITDQQFIHIIPSAIIYDETYSERAPEFTRLNVYSTLPLIGKYGDTVEQETQQWAGSVDYDLWRNYGYKEVSIDVQFLRTNEQAVLYAHQLMARQYSKILTGRIIVRGDSKYQLGDTVFIEDENLYYYIVGISHSFTYGSQYSTALELEYGRRPGYYIPYPFDVLGNRLISGIRSIYQTDPTDISALIDAFKAEQESQGD